VTVVALLLLAPGLIALLLPTIDPVHSMESIPYHDQTIRRWQIGQSTFLAWPEAGARLMHWNVMRADGTVREIVHWPQIEQMDTPVAKIRGGNPILFPFCARTFDRGKIHHWQSPDDQQRPMPMHGFARQGNFSLDRIDDQGFRAVLQPTLDDRANYPFDYEFSVSYRFEAHALTCEFSLKNLGSTPIPWSAGHHFYFTVPWTDGLARDDYVLVRPACRTVRQDGVGALIAGPKLPSSTPLYHPALVDTIHVELADHRFRFGPVDGSEYVDVTIGTDPQPKPERAMVTWTADPAAPFYCVEPWMGPPNAPEHQRGLEWVAAGETGQFTVGVSIG